jgi:signal peptidase II
LKRLRPESFILPVTAALVLIADQISKAFVVQRLAENQSWDIAPWLSPVLSITHVTNTGAAFGMLQNLNTVFAIIGLIAVVTIIVYARRIPAGQWMIRVALGLALGGAMGNNLVDRLRQGYVVDFLDLNFWPLHNWPVFNVADASIVTGVALLTLVFVWEERCERREQQAVEGA